MKHKKNNINYKWLWFLFIVIGIIFIIFYKKKEGFNDNNIKYLDGIDIIYWINLDRSKVRRDNMKQMLKDEVFEGIPDKRIIAYDGKNDTKNVYDKLIIENKKQSDTEYACLLSHLETIRIFNDSSNKVALIFEDDVTLEFKKYWKKSVKEIMDNAPADWEIIMLSYIFDFRREVLFDNWSNSSQEYDKNNDTYFSTIAYLINKKGSNKLMNIYNNNKYVLNNSLLQVADSYIYTTLNTYVYKYPMFIYKTDNDSLIHADHLNIHVKSKNKIIEKFKKCNII
jgi:GR25 family glycosyltransferase involved in LPS biosynthesis